jgi:hypothetical protein
MPTPHDQEILEYLARSETLPDILTIVRQAAAIRARLLGQFWSELQKYLEGETPKSLQGCSMRWDLWPDPQLMDGYEAGLYYRDDKLGSQPEMLRYYVFQEGQYSLIYGIGWEEPQAAYSLVWKSPEVATLRKFLSDSGFGQTQRSIGRREIHNWDSAETFLIKYDDQKEQRLRETSERFWAMVQDTFEMVAQANRALQNSSGS